MSTSTDSERAAAALALVSLPEMTHTRLRCLLDRWPDPFEAVAAVRAGRARAVLRNGDTHAGRALIASWGAELDFSRARAQVAARQPRVFLRGDEAYPIDPLVPDAPAILIAEGDRLDALDQPRVAVVGTRAATPNGLDDAAALGAALAAEGITVISGMAIGIDGAAHRGALAAGGLAIGVVATGLDIVYPRRHELLFREVGRSGVLLSELPYGTGPERHRFPVRNRIIAALADVVVVVEATQAGGARITADDAETYGRPVLAVPGSRRNASAAGCNALIADGAQVLLDPSDVFLTLGMTPGARRGWSRDPDRPAPSGDAAEVLEALGGEPATADQLASRTGLSGSQVSVAVSRLERDRWVVRERGMVWPR